MPLRPLACEIAIERLESPPTVQLIARCPIPGCPVTETITAAADQEAHAQAQAIGRIVAHLKRHHQVEVTL